MSGQWKPNLTDRYDAADWYEEAGMTGESQIETPVAETGDGLRAPDRELEEEIERAARALGLT